MLPAPPRWVLVSREKEGGLVVVLLFFGVGREEKRKERVTHASGVSAVALVAEGSLADDFAVRVGFFVVFDVAGA